LSSKAKKDNDLSKEVSMLTIVIHGVTVLSTFGPKLPDRSIKRPKIELF